jgi:hypothetical protein
MSYGNNPMYQFMRNADLVEEIARKRALIDEEREWESIEAGEGLGVAPHLRWDQSEQFFTSNGLWVNYSTLSREEKLACVQARRDAEIAEELRRQWED